MYTGAVNRRYALLVSATLLLAGATIVALVHFSSKQPASQSFQKSRPTSFAQCAAEGYPIQESYPRRCAVPGGQTFTEDIALETAVQTISQGSSGSGFETPSEKVITSYTDLQKLWTQWQSASGSQVPPMPSIDFHRDIVIAVFDGAQGAGGYSVKITDVSERGGQYVVRIEQTKPGPRCATAAVLTYPHHIIRFTYSPSTTSPYTDDVEPNTSSENAFQFSRTTKVTSCED